MTPEQEALLRDADECECPDDRAIEEIVQALARELRAALDAIDGHNRACQENCGEGKNEAVQCGYRPYFLNNGRRCSTCGVHWKITADDFKYYAARAGKESPHQYVRRVTTDAGGQEDKP